MCSSRRCRRAPSPTRARSIIPGIFAAIDRLGYAGLGRRRIQAARRAPRTGSAGRGRYGIGPRRVIALRQDTAADSRGIAACRGRCRLLSVVRTMWGRKRKTANRRPKRRAAAAAEAMRCARAHRAAERTGVVVELHDAEIARLETSQRRARSAVRRNPARRRSVRSRHQPGRHAAAVDRRRRPCRDGPRQAASIASCRTPATAARCWPNRCDIAEMVEAVTKYVARRMIERERALAERPTAR